MLSLPRTLPQIGGRWSTAADCEQIAAIELPLRVESGRWLKVRNGG